MYACDFGVRWMDHPFLRGHLLVRTEDDVTKIRGMGIRELTIDTTRGADIGIGLSPAQDPIPTGSAIVPPALVPETFADERTRARRLASMARKEVRSLMDEVRMGGRVPVDRAAAVVDVLMGSVLRNSSALVSLLRIKDKDNYTYVHSLSVSTLLVSFAVSLNQNEAQIREAGLGGLLHDIGKMRVPLEILSKPGPLTADEAAVMRRHTECGSQLIADCGDVPATIARHHHERMDGTGYPDGLRGDEISAAAKMSAIVDVYDAMTSERCYHKGLPAPIALARMWESRGTHFDEKLLQAFMRCVGLYPVGSLVRLSDDRLAVVVEEDGENLLTPRLRVIYNLRQGAYLPPTDLDLARLPTGNRTRIVGHESPGQWNIDLDAFLD